MPIDYVLATLGVPVKLHFAPQLVDFLGKSLLLVVARAEILAHAEQALHEEAALHKVTAIILLSEGLHLACGSVEPVRPHAVEAVGFCEIVNYLGEALHALLAVYEATVDGCKHSGDAESATTGCHHVLVVLRVVTVEVYALTGETRSGLGTIPHIVEVYFLDVIEQFVVVSELGGTLRFLLCCIIAVFALVRTCTGCGEKHHCCYRYNIQNSVHHIL